MTFRYYNETEARELEELRPDFRSLVKILFHRMNGYCTAQTFHTRIVFGGRTPVEQWSLYAKGRRYIRSRDLWLPVPLAQRVTNARPWETAHVVGLGCDLAICDDRTRHYLPDRHAFWHLLGEQAELLGLQWGGRWKSPVDLGHVEMPAWKVAATEDLATIRKIYSAPPESVFARSSSSSLRRAA